MPSVRFYPLNRNPLHLVERDLISRAVVELRGARAFMRGHRLCVLQRAAGFKIGGDARGAEGMAADPGSRAELGGAALDHAPGVDPVYRFVRQRAGAARGGEASVEAFMIKHRANLRTNCLEPREQCDRRWTPVRICLDGYIAFSLDIGDLLQQQFDAGEFAQQLRLRFRRSLCSGS
jgi:hypothetical protein